MSKYTTEVRFICESKAGEVESVGFNKIDDVLEKSWDKIFTTQCAFFDEEYRKPLCKKILKHYYTREIGAETVGLWMLWMNTKLEEIMPYYNQLYKSELLEFDPLSDVKITRTHNRKNDGTSNVKSDTTGNTTDNTNRTYESQNAYSETPQGTLANIENHTYLTNARIIKDNENVDNTTDTTTNTTTDNTISNVEDYLEEVTGKQGSENYSSMVLKFRETFLNIDMMVINEFKDLFLNLW